ncbi:HNH endonuclease [Mycolicibacterium diernhoferi]|uniref:HNH endonuclease n=1 Tax=Mycolicibacterium diernhoferi TaxID=1801 RepID=UPI001041FE93|nr:HNH endonuclease [Mycolicibacterium diernhoferi]QYL20734.1 HNH endonuclease [Mycolicibacterium diernhoferi]
MDRHDDERIRTNVRAAISALEANCETYRKHAASSTLHLTGPGHYPVPNLSDEDMKKLYRNRLVRTVAGRRIYDKLIAGAQHGLCTYCQYGEASALDHFMPKDFVPSLAIEPWNLIPCCSRCNHGMGAKWSDDPGHEMLHPYFMPDLGRWLYATITHTSPPSVAFVADPPGDLDSQYADRLRRQFDDLKLGELYSVVSTVELTSLNERLPTLYTDVSQLTKFLAETADIQFSADINDRRGVMYEALALDDWYQAQICVGPDW